MLVKNVSNLDWCIKVKLYHLVLCTIHFFSFSSLEILFVSVLCNLSIFQFLYALAHEFMIFFDVLKLWKKHWYFHLALLKTDLLTQHCLSAVIHHAGFELLMEPASVCRPLSMIHSLSPSVRRPLLLPLFLSAAQLSPLLPPWWMDKIHDRHKWSHSMQDRLMDFACWDVIFCKYSVISCITKASDAILKKSLKLFQNKGKFISGCDW